VPAHLQALADESAEPEEPKDETSFRTLLTELDSMEEGLKTDFDDLLRDVAPIDAPEPEPAVAVEVAVEIQPQPQQPSAAELARERLRAAVAALEQRSAMSEEALEAQALAEAIEQERRELED